MTEILRKKLWLFLALLSGITILASCEDFEEEKKDEPLANNTIIVFMPYSQSLTDSRVLLSDLYEIENGIKQRGSMAGYNLIVYYAQSNWNSLLFREKMVNGAIVRDTLETYKNFNQSDEEALGNLLTRIKRECPSDTYSIIIGSHGSAWLPSTASLNWGRATDKKKSFGGASGSQAIEIPTFRKAIERASLHFNYILFDNCYLANIETLYEVRNCADYIIACPSEQPGDGMPYLQSWKYMSNTPDYENIINEYNKFYNPEGHGYGNLSVTCTKYLDEMAALMYDINHNQRSDFNVDDVQPMAGGVAPMFFDLGDYVRKICADLQLLNEYIELEKKLIPWKTTSDKFFTHKDNESFNLVSPPLNAYSGLTISDPTINSALINIKQETSWWKDTH